MKKITAFLMLTAVMAAFAGCEKPEKTPEIQPDTTQTAPYTKISGRIEGMPSGSGYTLKLESHDWDSDKEIVLAACPIASDCSFSMDLPKTLGSNRVLSIDEFYYDFLQEPLQEVVVNTNSSVGITRLNGMALVVYHSSRWVGGVRYFHREIDNTTDSYTIGYLCYADGDTKITCTWQEPNIMVDLDFKKGWNWMFMQRQDNTEDEYSTLNWITDIPSNVGFVME